MRNNGIRVLVVDDSAVIRAMICDSLSKAPDLEVVGTACDGHRALEAVDRLAPDVVTLDVQMPNLDGLATLDALLARRPVPVIMVSAMTRAGADVTLDALERGAMDYVAKPESGAETAAVLGEELLRKIRMVAGADVRRILEIRRQRQARRPGQPTCRPAPKAEIHAGASRLSNFCVAIGISTGGPPALTRLFETLRPPMPPIVIVQHMPPDFTKPLAWRLDALTSLTIKEAATGDVLQPNQVLIAPGGQHLQVHRYGNVVQAVVRDGEPVCGHKPSVDVMMSSVVEAFGSRCLGVIMTGMGRDGADGCRRIRAAGGYVLGQDEATSDVYGMNKVAFVEGHVHRQFALGDAAMVITRQIQELARTAVGPISERLSKAAASSY